MLFFNQQRCRRFAQNQYVYVFTSLDICTLFANIINHNPSRLHSPIARADQGIVQQAPTMTMGVNPFDPMAGKCRLPTLTLRKAGGAFCPSLFTPTPSDVRAVLVAGDWCQRRHGEASLPCPTHASGIYSIRMAGVAIVVGTRASVTARYMQHRPTDNSHRYDVQRHNNGRWGRASVR
jgi:hypothetical protein